MFNLIYRDGAPENAGHYEGVVTDGATNYAMGQAIYLDSAGKAKPCGGATNANKVYGIVCEDTDKSAPSVLVLKVERDMIFKCPITGTNAAKLFKGMRLAINNTDYGSVATATATLGADYVGATVVEALEAKNAGDFIEVRFEN